jgi:hypothetical protein
MGSKPMPRSRRATASRSWWIEPALARQMKRWIKFAAFVFAFALAIYLTSYISRLPEANCTTGPVSSLSSGDHVYKATLLKRDCNLGETAFYSVRIDSPGEWFPSVAIEEDPYPTQAVEPTMKWDSHKLEIKIFRQRNSPARLNTAKATLQSCGPTSLASPGQI